LSHCNPIVSKLGDNAYFCRIRSVVHNWSLDVPFIPGPTYVCTIGSGVHNIKCFTTIRLGHLQGILPKLALLAYIDILAVQAKCTHNKSVVDVKTTRDCRQLTVTNQKSLNAALSLNFSGGSSTSHFVALRRTFRQCSRFMYEFQRGWQHHLPLSIHRAAK